MTDTTKFTSTVRFCGLFKPLRLPLPDIVRYGCTVNADDVPADLTEYVVRKPISPRYTEARPDLAGSVWCHLKGRFTPTICLTNGMDAVRQLVQLCEMAEATNITPDRLLNECPATLAVRPIEYIAPVTNRGPRLVKELQIVAIQFVYDDLIKRFDQIQREYFTQPPQSKA